MSVFTNTLELARISRGHTLRRPPPRWLPVALYLLLALAVCRGLLVDPMHRVVAGNPHDEALISYLLQAEPTLLLHGHNPLLITTLNAPDGVNAMWNTGLLLPALVLAPLTLTLGGTLSFNLLLVLGLAGSAWSAFAVVRRWTERRVSAFLAGLVYGFSPAMSHQAIGHLHLVVAWLPPLMLAALVDVLRGPYRAVTSVRLGLLGAAQLLTGEELFAMTVIAGATVCLVLLASRPLEAWRSARAGLRGLAVAGFTFVAVAGYPVLFQLFGPRREYGSPFAFDVFKNDLTSFVTPDLLDPLNSLSSTSHLSSGSPESGAFLGWPLLLLAVVVLVRRWHDLRVRVVGCTALVLGVFSLGGTLRAGGVYTPVHLPWSFFQRLPLLESLLPNRFGILVAGLVGMLLAFAADSALKRLPRRFLAVAGVVLLVPLAPHVLATTSRPTTPSFISSGASHRYLATGDTVLVLPYATGNDTRAMDWQADDGLRWSMPGGFFLGPACRGRDCRARAYIDSSQPPVTADDLTLAKLQAADDVLVGPGPEQQSLVAAVTTLLGPGLHVDDSWVWSVP